MTQTRGRRTGPKSKGQEGGKTEKFPFTKPSPAYPPSIPHTISPLRLTRIAVSGSGSGRSRRWTAAAALAARRGSSRRRRQRSTTARSASGASMPRRGAQPPKTSPLPFLVCSPLLLLLLVLLILLYFSSIFVWSTAPVTVTKSCYLLGGLLYFIYFGCVPFFCV